MPIYQEESPLAAAAGFAGNYLDAQTQAQQQQALLARQQAAADAAAQQQAWKNAYDLRGQDNTLATDTQKRGIDAAMFPLDYQGKQLANQGSQVDTQGKIIANRVAGATAGATISQKQSDALDAQYRAAADQYKIPQAKAEATIAYINATYAPQEKAAALQEAFARLAQSQATTAETQQRTYFGGLEEPGKLQGTALTNQGRALTNQGDAIRNATGIFDLGQKQNLSKLYAGSDPKAVEADYQKLLSGYNARRTAYDKVLQKNPNLDQKKVPPPIQPISPADLPSVIQDTIDEVNGGRKDASGNVETPQTAIAKTDDLEKAGALTALQGRIMKAQLTAAFQAQLRASAQGNVNTSGFMGNTPSLGSSVGGQAFGGSGAGSDPFKLAPVMAQAEKATGIPSGLLRLVGLQESELGRSSNYNPATGTDRDANQGHGFWQLDPASGASRADLARAARDPAFAAQYAANMLAANLRASGGNVRKALAMYNDGTNPGAKGYAYADQVLSRARA